MVSHNKRIVAILAAVAAMGMGLAGCGSGTAGDAKAPAMVVWSTSLTCTVFRIPQE